MVFIWSSAPVLTRVSHTNSSNSLFTRRFSFSQWNCKNWFIGEQSIHEEFHLGINSIERTLLILEKRDVEWLFDMTCLSCVLAINLYLSLEDLSFQNDFREIPCDANYQQRFPVVSWLYFNKQSHKINKGSFHCFEDSRVFWKRKKKFLVNLKPVYP